MKTKTLGIKNLGFGLVLAVAIGCSGSVGCSTVRPAADRALADIRDVTTLCEEVPVNADGVRELGGRTLPRLTALCKLQGIEPAPTEQ